MNVARWRAYACVLLVLGLLALVAAPLAAQGRRANRPRPATPAMDLPTRPLASILRVGEVRATIGRDEEEGPYLFGSIELPTLGGDGTVYIGEYSTATIRAFDRQGNHLGTFGRKGRGPGEFVQPFSLWHDGDSTLFASTPSMGVTEITARGGRFSYRRTFGTGAGFGSFCTLDGRLFVSVGGDSGVVAELDDARAVTRRFGTVFVKSDTASVRAIANQGGPSLLCDRSTGALYASRGDLGVIRRYDASGVLRWESTLPAFQHAIYGSGGGSPFVAWSVDYIASVLPLGSTRLLVIVARRDFASTSGRSRAPGAMFVPDVSSMTAYELDAATGRVLSRVRGVAEYLRLSDTLVAERVMDPYPMIRLRAVRPASP